MKPAIAPLSILLSVLVLPACTTIDQTLYLQDVEIKGPISQPSVHITTDRKANEFRIAPRVSVVNQRRIEGTIDGHSKVDAIGMFRVDTVRDGNGIYFREKAGANNLPFSGKNLRWTLPQVTLGLDVDYGLSDRVALLFGATYANEGRKDLWGFRGGLGFCSVNPTSAVRLDVGVQWQTLAYEATTVVVEEVHTVFSPSMSRVGFFRDSGTGARLNLYASLTLNSIRPERGYDFFVQLAVSGQSLANFKPNVQQYEPWIVNPFYMIPTHVTDLRANFSSTAFFLTPGIFVPLTGSARVVAGVRVGFQTGIDAEPGTLIFPIVQFDFNM